MKAHNAFIFLLLFGLQLPSEVKAQGARAGKKLVFIEDIELNGSNPIKSSSLVPTIKDNKVQTAIIPYETVEAELTTTSPLQFKYAQLLDVDIEKIANIRLYSLLDEWMNTRYRYGGNAKSGIDCSGFTGMIYRKLNGLTLPRMASEQYRACEKISQEEMQEGDLVFFNTRGGVSHVGLYLHNGYFVHASTKEGVIISNLLDGYYHRTFIGPGRINEALLSRCE